MLVYNDISSASCWDFGRSCLVLLLHHLLCLWRADATSILVFSPNGLSALALRCIIFDWSLESAARPPNCDGCFQVSDLFFDCIFCDHADYDALGSEPSAREVGNYPIDRDWLIIDHLLLKE